LKEEKKGGKKDGDQMRITKEKLVEIIKEELENLEEGPVGKTGNPKRPGLKRFFSRGKGRASDDPKYNPKVAMDDRAGEIDAMDSAAGLNKGQKKAYSAAIADASSDAAKMDAKSSQKDFERVLKWANDNDIATDKQIAAASAEQDEAIQSILNRFDTLDDTPEEVGDSLVGNEAFVNNIRAKVASGKLFNTTFLPRIKSAIKKQMKEMPSMEAMLNDPKFIDQLINNINQRKHTPGE
jgi:hypothetical protein